MEGIVTAERMSRDSRHIFDVCATVMLLMVVSPIFLMLVIFNRILTGRAFYRQTRLGRDLRPFMLLKFQTMVNAAEKGSSVTSSRDSRITPYGRVLRALKLDELPQLINVLRGEMNLVGPRPLTPNEVGGPVQRHLATVVYRVRPGLTGIGAIAFADEEWLLARVADPERAYFADVLPRKITLELAYAQRRTWFSDLFLLFFTPLAPYFRGLRRRVLIWLVPEWEALVWSGSDRFEMPAG